MLFRSLGGQGHHFLALADADLDGGIHLDVDVLGVGDVIGGLDIHTEHLQGELIQPLQEGNADACFTDENARFAETGDDVGGIRGCFHIAQVQQTADGGNANLPGQDRK